MENYFIVRQYHLGKSNCNVESRRITEKIDKLIQRFTDYLLKEGIKTSDQITMGTLIKRRKHDCIMILSTSVQKNIINQTLLEKEYAYQILLQEYDAESKNTKEENRNADLKRKQRELQRK